MSSSYCPSVTRCCFRAWYCPSPSAARRPWRQLRKCPHQRRVGLLLRAETTGEVQDGAAPSPETLHPIARPRPVRFITAPDGTHHLIAQGEERFSVLDYVSREPFLVVRIEEAQGSHGADRETEARGLNLRDKALAAVQAGRRRRRGSLSTPFPASNPFPCSPTWSRVSWI